MSILKDFNSHLREDSKIWFHFKAARKYFWQSVGKKNLLSIDEDKLSGVLNEFYNEGSFTLGYSCFRALVLIHVNYIKIMHNIWPVIFT